MITLLVVGAIAWVLTGAVEDTIRSARGDAPRSERRGLRGYLDDRWKALADHHHAVAASGLLTAGDARMARKHLARTKALKLAGLASDEEVARAKAEHQHRLGFIAKGIDPDTMPPLFPVHDMVWEPAEPEAPTTEPIAEATPGPPADPATPEPTVDDHFRTNTDVWTDPKYFLPEPTPGPEHWSPYAPTNNTDTKEHQMVNSGEITGPAGVLQFHDDLAAVMDATATIVDTLTGTAADLEKRAAEMGANLTATETASDGMTALGMTDAASAAMALMETQQAIQDAMNALAAAMNDHAGTTLDQATASASHLAAIKAAHDAQLSVQDARAGAGRGNLATDSYLDND